MEKVRKLNLIFLSLVEINDLNDSNIYADLLRHFVNMGHHVTCFCPFDRTKDIAKNIESKDFNLYRFRIPKIQKANKFEKAIGLFAYDLLLKRALKSKLKHGSYDLLLYSTPPINFINSIKYLKAKYKLRTYLLLKDIFPQNAVDLGIIKEGSFIYSFFRKTEKRLYNLSDTIGCMSTENVHYIERNNPYLSKEKKIEVCPNSIQLKNLPAPSNETFHRSKYGIGNDARVFIYGGNLGKPQAIDFLVNLLEHFMHHENIFFIILGSGTEYQFLNNWFITHKPSNALLKSYVPKKEYDAYLSMSDIGLVFLNPNFTIPNYPSRVLSYMEHSLPILCFTDKISDIGKNALSFGYGDWTESNSLTGAVTMIEKYAHLPKTQLTELGHRGRKHLEEYYTVESSYKIILNT